MKLKNLQPEAGKSYGWLTAIEKASSAGNNANLWVFACKCGGRRVFSATKVVEGRINSCGCPAYRSWSAKRRAARVMPKPITHVVKHGLSRTRAYACYRRMIDRCENPNHSEYRNYGGRGINVCKRWRESVANFAKDMGEPAPGMTLERVDNNRGYEPANCRWAARSEQARNRRTNRLITAFGETKVEKDWAADPRCRVTRSGLSLRIRQGWSPEKAITVPPATLGRRPSRKATA